MELTFEEYITEIKSIMYKRYENAKKGIARHNIASVNADPEAYRDLYNEELTPLESIKEIELNNE